MKNLGIKAVFFLVLLIADQVTKVIAYTNLTEGIPVNIIPELFNFTLVYNPGVAFGLFGDWPDFYRRLVVFGVSAIALVVLSVFMFKDAKDDEIAQFALLAILSGAIGNIIDRFRFDKVVDFLDVFWGSYHWPAFNIADSAISIGVCVVILRFIFNPELGEKKTAEEAP